MIKILGYCDRLSVAPGDTIRFMVSSEEGRPYRARIVRIIHGDANPEGPGLKFEAIDTDVGGSYQGRRQRTDAGSFLRVADHPKLRTLESFTVLALIWPTTPEKPDQCLVAKWAPQSRAGFRFELAGPEGVSLTIGDGAGGVARVVSGKLLLSRRWYLVAAAYDAAKGEIAVVQRPLQKWPHTDDMAEVNAGVEVAMAVGEGPLLMAGATDADGIVDDHYNGKIDSPMLLDAALPPGTLEGALVRPVPHAIRRHIVGAWDFSKEIPGTRALDSGPNGLHGELVHLPARAMKGWNWNGDTIRWTERPEHYGAIHFHDDDLYDSAWESDFSLTVPDGLRPGAYAAHVEVGDAEDGTEEDYITFFVRSPRRRNGGAVRPKVAFLVPTASYMAYANDHTPSDGEPTEMVIGRLLTFQPSDIYINEHRELGLALYDTHSDGSGVCYSSYLRPILNMRPKYQSWLGGHGSGLWQFNADTHLIDWLEHEGYDYDVITDEDLHGEGAAVLEPYQVLLTGTHPEYHSKRMSDALMAWLDRGGRLMYLGANGWYWRIAWHEELPGVIEVRRAEDGTRTWAAEPGEYYHSFTGEFGGLWRRNGRAPNEVVGLGFTAQGFDLCSYYRRTAESYEPRLKFIFAGVEEEIIGDFGLVGGGAAGLELDGADHDLGTPPNLVVLARSENHTDLILLVNEESAVTTPDMTGSQNDKIRADLAFFETPAGGAVFSTGSIAWCGSLSHGGYDNNISRITRNVLNRFLERKRFAT